MQPVRLVANPHSALRSAWKNSFQSKIIGWLSAVLDTFQILQRRAILYSIFIRRATAPALQVNLIRSSRTLTLPYSTVQYRSHC